MAVCRAAFSHSAGASELWFAVPSRYAGWLNADVQDPFALALLVLAMHRGEDLHIEGSISEKLFYSLSHYAIPILSIVTGMPRVHIVPEALTHEIWNDSAAAVATGFSAGVDSLCAVADHYLSPVPDGFRLNHLLFYNVGSHGRGPEGRRLFQQRLEHVRPAADELGLPLLAVDSNLGDALPLDFHATSTVRNMAATLALQKGVKTYLYASSHRYRDCGVRPAAEMSFCEPAAVHLFSTESTQCISCGSQYSRVDKTRRIADLPLAHRFLNVCVDPTAAANCSVCFKCTRTLLTLELLGKLEPFSRIFDPARYRAVRNHYLLEVLLSDGSFEREIRECAAEIGFEFPASCRRRAALHAAYRRLRVLAPQPLRRAVRRVLPRPRPGLAGGNGTAANA